MDLLTTKYLRALISYSGINRVEKLPIPEAALREALLNAVIHRDYSVAAPIQIRVYSDHLRIWNPGQLPEGWTFKKVLGSHGSRPHNPLIAEAFFRAGEVEAWGRGIQRIFEECKGSGLPKPQLSSDGGEWAIEFAFGPEYLESAKARPEVAAGEKVSVKTTPITTPIRILQLVRENPEISQSGLAEILGLSRDGVRYHMKKLVLAGRVRYIGSTRDGHWEVLQETDS